MKSRIAVSIFVAVIPGIASAKTPPRRVTPAGAPAGRPSASPSTPAPAVDRRSWIPAGRFGLILDDGTRMIGILPERWSGKFQTRFGPVSIPRDRLASIEPVASEVRVVLTNGDSLSGTFASKALVFETRFGTLKFPMKSLVRLDARQAPRRRITPASIAAILPRIKGNWIVTYTNRTQQSRNIHENQTVNEGDRLVAENGDLLIVFPGVIERITLAGDKLFVEHFNPGSTYPDGIPTVMGVGRRAADK